MRKFLHKLTFFTFPICSIFALLILLTDYFIVNFKFLTIMKQILFILSLCVLVIASCEDTPIEVPGVGGELSDSLGIELPTVPTINCDCPTDIDLVCVDGVTFPNACVAECLDLTNYVPGACVGSGFDPNDWPIPSTGSPTIPTVTGSTSGSWGGFDPNDWPVPSTGSPTIPTVTGSTSGSWGGFDPSDWPVPSTGATSGSWGGFDPNNMPTYDFGDIDCDCELELDPVCADGDITLPNSCIADCLGLSYTSGECN